jgi:putative transposase
MPRSARVVIPGFPHHVIQRGNRSQRVFFSDDDRILYLNFLVRYAKRAGVEFWAYCLMENHVHLIAVPKYENSLAVGLGETHKAYTKFINAREDWKGYLWQGRFLSFPMDERYLYAAMRYVELNPVRAGIVQKAEDYPWSSANAHIFQKKDILLKKNCFIEEIGDWAGYLRESARESENSIFKKHSSSGKLLGDEFYWGNVVKK